MTIDPKLTEFATVRQIEFMDAINEHGSAGKAAKALGINKGTITKAMRALQRRAAALGYSPDHDMTRTAPAGFMVKGTSTLYDKEGRQAAQWVKTTVDRDQQIELLRQFVADLCEEAKGRAPVVAPPAFTNADLLTIYPIGDHHHGMFADHAETGDGYNMVTSIHRLESAFDHLVNLAPPSETALMINLGDFLHANDHTSRTEHGNVLDVDGRFGQALHSGAMALVRCVLKLLAKHQHVIVWNVRGNHDRDAALALAMAMSFYFHNEPRVTVDIGLGLYKYHRFGRCLFGSHHGHGAKAQDLPLIMAEDRKEDWGQTDHRVWHCGHIHHLTRKDYVGCTVETHRGLPGTDAWHSGQGYRSKKDMNAIVYHRQHGEIQRTRFEMGMLEAA